MSMVSADQLVVDEKVIRINGDDYWLHGAVDSKRTKSCSLGCFRRRNR